MKTKYLVLLGLLLTVVAGCKKFLNVTPLDDLSGNNFWETQADVESFTNDVYRIFKDEFAMKSAILFMGDVRCAPVTVGAAYPPRGDVAFLSKNDLKSAIAADASRTSPTYDAIKEWWQRNTRWDLVDDWSPLFKVVQAANILYEEAPNVQEKDAGLSDKIVKQYQAEAVFMRCLSYFYLIRLYGDVPYFTNAYNESSLPRASHVEVAKNCIADLEKHRADLPWAYPDPTYRAIRAMQSSALALEMHLNMWLAGFDKTNALSYYQKVDELGDVLYNEGELGLGVLRLYPIDQIFTVFQGRSQEGLFEIPQNVNYGLYPQNRRMTYAGTVIWESNLTNNSDANSLEDNVEMNYMSNYLKTLYPEDQADERIKAWFTFNNTNTMYAANSQMLKFYNIALGPKGGDNALSNNYFIFRYPDAILLQAEALASMSVAGNTDGSSSPALNDKAAELLNRIRSRAGAPAFPANPGDGDLLDAIFYERCKELMGEGHYYYDMVRSGKIYNPKYNYTNSMSYGQFLQGAWTWPINKKAQTSNPLIQLNNYWN
ncbi:RagB/SusD family nutrient uptake outer membrane protein [Niabella ginsengisoli]|uniref:RagB/SusD family nutrient uptake outer membrane protein n=1 Tax=Niabella ginsengisoli TaxID=522298 RepID=A0ABS9SIW4_9BACT|nr:RagB/SusD family nutrient uptake outer membrane protein [Niabella ginsengisoli]MCH5598306.1 RagB/SusD family nutrient uptake outer membrane protein [Niabella ginsengisoli]